MRAAEFLIPEFWSKKYKRSIDCSRPRGFSQRAHCAGRKARQAGHKTKSKSVNENQGRAKLGQLAEITTNFADADFWLVRRGSENMVGRPTREFNPEHIGIKVTATDVLDPGYLYYAMQWVYNQGYWRQLATGTLRLVNIKTSDVKNLPLG